MSVLQRNTVTFSCLAKRYDSVLCRVFNIQGRTNSARCCNAGLKVIFGIDRTGFVGEDGENRKAYLIRLIL
ncbi:MAG: hypothetical protein ACLS27_06825 [Eubacterium sp.]